MTGKVIEPIAFKQVRTAVIEWARDYYGTDDIIVHIFDSEGDEPDRYIVVLAVRGLDEWQAAEVWLEDGRVVSINDLGEGVPPDDAVWPWPN